MIVRVFVVYATQVSRGRKPRLIFDSPEFYEPFFRRNPLQVSTLRDARVMPKQIMQIAMLGVC